MFGIGLAFDLVTACYMLAPLALWLALVPDRVARSWPHRALMVFVLAAAAFGALLLAVSEWLFWDEFGSRFNFIAVDYLLYTHEVLGNIWQSYPVGKVLIGLLAVALACTVPFRRMVWEGAAESLQPELRQFLSGQLPEHAVPSLFVALPELPLTAQGKVDRRALPEPELVGAESTAPRTPVEELVAEAFAELLGIERAGAEDNFFELGGHSLLATRLVSRLREAFGTYLDEEPDMLALMAERGVTLVPTLTFYFYHRESQEPHVRARARQFGARRIEQRLADLFVEAGMNHADTRRGHFRSRSA